MFLVDGSGSIEFQGRGNFQRSKEFIIALVNTFEVGRDQVNVATVLYWHHYRIIHHLNKYYSNEEVVKAIQDMPYPSGGTRTGQGLDVIRNNVLKNLGDRSQLTNIVVVVTDGLSQDSVVAPAEKLREMGVIIISIGVGCCYYKPELNEIASDPDNDHVFDVSFRDLGNIVGPLRQQICFGKQCLFSCYLQKGKKESSRGWGWSGRRPDFHRHLAFDRCLSIPEGGGGGGGESLQRAEVGSVQLRLLSNRCLTVKSAFSTRSKISTETACNNGVPVILSESPYETGFNCSRK